MTLPVWMTPWRPAQRLRTKGILSMNCRNRLYISRYNKRRLYPLVDDKLKTKRLALDAGVNVPELLGVVENQHDTAEWQSLVKGVSGFCIKPAKGSGGKGILVIVSQRDGKFYKSNGDEIAEDDIERHLSNILSGLFSLGGAADVAVIEALIEVDDAFSSFTYEGVPDLRVIVFLGYPVMAMMRLSCRSSHGKANLHQGAVGVGIHIATGQAVNAVQNGKIITEHPDTGQNLKALQVPEWQGLLNLATACYDMSGLGYLGVDLVLDKQKGPLLLELNARPGLSIQVANNAGLLPRLRQVEAEHVEDLQSARVEKAQEWAHGWQFQTQ